MIKKRARSKRQEVRKPFFVVFSGLISPVPFLCVPLTAAALPVLNPAAHLRVTVDSNQDGAIAADSALTLREAIQLVNGTLPLNRLSPAEKAQVKSVDANIPSRIEFKLPSGQTTIQLTDILPPLAAPGLVVDGTTQPGYARKQGKPLVAITPAPKTEIFRGFTVVADGVTIPGSSLYGFTAQPRVTGSTPPADIFIASSQVPPKNVVIENNWLGIAPNKAGSSPRSAFGVSVFNSLGTTIKHNRIENHDGSGIITRKQAEDLHINQNIIERNGLAGMPDAIRLEGNIQNSEISSNLIQDNAGSAIYTFKPEGSVQIRLNTITKNGKKLRQAAIYLMENNHLVINNKITKQPGSGVVVAAYPQSLGNRIQGNQFSDLAGLAIDLVTQQNVSPQDYQQGDVPNPPTDSYQRRRKTGNFGIDAPRWLSPEFFVINPHVGVTLDGLAEPGSQVEIYRSGKDAGTQELHGLPIATVNANAKGRFSVTLGNLKPRDRVSAIATHPRYGTSEPALNAVIQFLPSHAPQSL